MARLAVFTVSRFNPRAREGRDGRLQIRNITAKGFNPRAREGRDRGLSAPCGRTECFNPRAREGRDIEKLRFLFLTLVSIHAPARGATFCGSLIFSRCAFQSTRPRGARLVYSG